MGAGTAQNAPAAPATPAAGGYTPYAFTQADINHIAQTLNPEMAATLGLNDWTVKQPSFWTTIGQRVTSPLATSATASDWRNTLFPVNDPNVINTLYQGDRWSLPEVTQFMGQLTNTMDQLEALRAQQHAAANQPAGTPGAPGTNTGTGGTFGSTEFNAYRRPLDPAEQQFLDYVRAMNTGRNPVSPADKATIQAGVDQALKTGTPNIANLVGQVANAQQSNPGTYIYNAAQGMLPREMSQRIAEQAAMSMGNIGQRFGTNTAGVTARALAEAANERALQAQGLLGQANQNAALLMAQRQQAAQNAMLNEYLQSNQIDPAASALLNLLMLNRGNTSTDTSVIPGVPSMLALAQGLAEGGQIMSSMGGSIPQINSNANMGALANYGSSGMGSGLGMFSSGGGDAGSSAGAAGMLAGMGGLGSFFGG